MAEPYRAYTPLATGTVTASRRFRDCENPAVLPGGPSGLRVR